MITDPLITSRFVKFDVEGTTVRLTYAEAQKLRGFLNSNHKKLRPEKNWNTCPYENHSNDCTCGGAGGDR